MKTVMERVQEHYNEALKYFSKDSIVGIFLHGSQNYGLDVEGSDVDTKLVVVPTFQDIAMAKKPVSTTHIRENDEHIDFKDVRLMLQTFRKQNLNFIEILFTPYFILNPLYADIWKKLMDNREAIAHYSPYAAVKTMRGIAMEKYHAMEHKYPTKIAIIDKFGYDTKQLHHLLRIEEYLRRYIAGDSYEACLHPQDVDYLRQVKLGFYDLDSARDISRAAIECIALRASEYCNSHSATFDENVDDLLNEVQYKIMEIAVKKELGAL